MYARSSVRRACVVLSIVALSALGQAASAQTNAYYTVGTYTVDAAHSVTGVAFAGYDGSSTHDSMGHPYSPTVNVVAGGSIGSVLDAFNRSYIVVNGGSIGGYLAADDSSEVNFVGGSAGGGLDVEGSSTAFVSGGTFGKFSGSVNFVDRTTSLFIFYGDNLMAVSLGADPGFLGGTDYALSGTLQGGTNLSGYIINVGTGARMFMLQPTPIAIPEPGSAALLVGMGVSGAGLLVRRRRANV